MKDKKDDTKTILQIWTLGQVHATFRAVTLAQLDPNSPEYLVIKVGNEIKYGIVKDTLEKFKIKQTTYLQNTWTKITEEHKCISQWMLAVWK